MMFVVMSVALLFADAGSAALKEFCEDPRNYSISLSEGTIAAQAGLCVVLPCSFTTDTGFNVAIINWSKYDGKNSNKKIFNSRTNKDADSEFKGRVSLLDSDLQKKNCSIIINDLRESDSGSYQLRVISDKGEGYSFWCHANITVTALSQRPTVMIPPLTEGQQTTLTCTAPGLCSGSVPEISWKWRRPGSNETEIRGNITDFQTENLTAVTQKHSSTLTFDPSAEHHGTEVTCEVRFMSGITTEEAKTLNVTYLEISGNMTLKEGDDLNVTCSLEGFPASPIMWTKSGSNQSLHEVNANETQESHGKGSLIIPNMSREDSGQYVCTATHLNTTLMKTIDVTLSALVPRILKDSGCQLQSEVLTCVCISEGLPLPSISWPLLKTHTEYSVTTTVSNTTVNSTVTVSVKDNSSTTSECESSNDAGKSTKTLTINKINETPLKAPNLCPQKVILVTIAVVSLLANIILMIYIVFLRKSRKTETPDQEDRTYMTLQKREESPEYDVIGQSMNA
ncbi:sialic acid-binding Ig-like lectin 14 isoform 1-T1 [Pholidichthys leucotaenia]